MYDANLYGNFDYAMLVFDVFVIFFIGLVIYLRREDRREGYPLEDDVSGRLEGKAGLFFAAQPKTFLLSHGETLTKPNDIRESQEVNATRTSRAPGSPLEPKGDPMLAGVGPGAFAHRAKTPDPMLDGSPKIVPLRAAPGFSIDVKDADPRGMKVIGVDGAAGGVVTDIWVDKAEFIIRYVELAVTPAEGAAAIKHVLVPMPMVDVKGSSRTVKVDAILGSQFAGAPLLANPDQITLDEEERVAAYYGGGYLYATAARSEPFL